MSISQPFVLTKTCNGIFINTTYTLVQAEDMKVIVSRFEDIQEIFQDEYSATRIADGIRTETQEL